MAIKVHKKFKDGAVIYRTGKGNSQVDVLIAKNLLGRWVADPSIIGIKEKKFLKKSSAVRYAKLSLKRFDK